jgi:hypothetical protein
MLDSRSSLGAGCFEDGGDETPLMPAWKQENVRKNFIN